MQELIMEVVDGVGIEGGCEERREGGVANMRLADEDVLTRSSDSSSQLIGGPPADVSAEGMQGWASHTSEGLIIEDCPSQDGSYFILDEGGQHVLDDQGSPARARKWQPVNVQQRERYTRLHLATKGPRATCRWLPSVLVSPDHLKVPKASRAKDGNSIKGVRFGGINPSAGFTHHQQFPAASIITGSGCAGDDHGEDEDRLGEERRREIEVAKKRRRFLEQERRRTRPKQLDGFMLMDACGCDLPDEGRRADVSGRGLVSTVREDLTFFLRLKAVDAGDNSLSFDSFVDLPRLEELRLPCNSIRDIDFSKLFRQQQQLLVGSGNNGGGSGGGYTELRRLDLSYNCLSGDALSALVLLPNLTDLDLTCNGLTNLPETMGRFPQLQKLSLERNQLESDTVFEVLSELAALRELNLAFNYFTGVNLKPETVECAFPLLEGLDLGFNYIGSERDVSVLVLLDRLQRVVLYGNPLAGPTGEDSLGLCVENLIAESDRIRGEYAGFPIEVITELPRTKQSQGPAKAGQSGGGGMGRRRRPYGDMGVTMVDEGCLPPAAAFRDAGNRSLFRFERRLRDGGGGGGDGGGNASKDDIVEATLRLARESNDRAAMAASRSAAAAAAAAVQDFTFLTSVEQQQEEDDTSFAGGGGQGEISNGAHAADEGQLHTTQRASGLVGRGEMSTRLLRGPVDPFVRGDPVKLRMAMAALRYTLKHPVTSSMDVLWQNQREVQRIGSSLVSKKDCGAGRKTAAARARQLPRRPYRPLRAQHDAGYCAGLLDDPAKKGGGDGGVRKRVDEVLTSMGAGMDAMVLEKRARQRSSCTGAKPGRPELSSIIRTVNAVLDENEY